MHTLTIDLEQGRKAYVNHNSDWFGNAIINYESEQGEYIEVMIPGAILLDIGRKSALEYVKNKIISLCEQL